jgi:formylmethanofuran dehydrogenase subunit B
MTAADDTTTFDARATTAPSSTAHHDNTPCPFCGILCDDLEIARKGDTLKIIKNGCDRAIAGFERAVPPAHPQLGGTSVSLDDAIHEAARLIRQAKLPLYGGLSLDVEGMRAALSLADRSGGVIDHAFSEGQYRNFKVLQSTGWVMTTLTETRNRADLIVIVGTDVHKLHPRFFERVVCNDETMFDGTASTSVAAKRTVVFIGKGLDQSALKGSRIGDVVTLACPVERVGEIIAALHARIKGTPLPANQIADVPVAHIDDLAARIHKAAYAVFVWAPPGLNYPNADLTVQNVSTLVRDLNKTQRCAGLSLGGNEGAVTAAAVSSWQSGFPLRISFASGKPNYDPDRYAIPKMLATGEGDVLIWSAAFTPDLGVPKTSLPTIVLGTPGLVMAQPAAVYIPVGTPGLDHAGRLIRCDNVVSLPLRKLKPSTLPSAAEVLAAIQAAL